MNYEIIISIDNGIQGGISIIKDDNINVYKMPTITKTINKKKKRIYDLNKLIEIFKPFYGKKVLFAIEAISIRPGEGGVSSMTIGKGYGILLGIAAAFEFDIVEIRPVVWKKFFPQLESIEIINFRNIIKKLKEDEKKLKNKQIKDKKEKKANKELIKDNKKEQEKVKRQIKSNAKNGARVLAKQLHPELGDIFEKTSSDGIAESLLIAIYGKEKQNELVQDN